MDRLDQIFECPDLHVAFPNQTYKTAARRTGQFNLKDIPVHSLHGKKGVYARAADNGQCVNMQDIDHGLSYRYISLTLLTLSNSNPSFWNILK